MLKKIYHIIAPFHFLLLIPFFLLHNINFYYGLIPGDMITSSFFAYLALSVSVFLFVKVILRTNMKAGIYSFVAMGYFFGFGAVKDFLDTSALLHKIASYSFLLPVIFLLLVLMLFYLRSTEKDFKKLNTFLFLAVTINLLLEVLLFSKNLLSGAEKKNDLGDTDLKIANRFTPCTNCEQPDIFYIIFDEYASSASLKKYFNYDNTVVDSFLIRNKFYISREAKSNYCFTSFSISATMKMDYLRLPPGYKEADARDLARGEYTVYNNNVVNILEKQGYQIHNNSIFDMKDYPSALGTYFFSLRRMFLNDETLFGRAKRDIGWNLMKLQSQKKRQDKILQDARKHIDQVADNFNTAFGFAKQSIENQDPAKKDFFYFHLMLPHDPFVFDSAGNRKYYIDYEKNAKEKYIDQLRYTNKKLMELIQFIQDQYKGKAVIILQGDHGYKQWPGDPDFWDIAFRNLNAVYLPDQNYNGYYETLSPVNTFRLLFNHYFNSQFEILPDKSIPVFVKKDLKKNYGIKQDEK